MTASNCFYLNPTLKLSWTNANQHCLDLYQGFMLVPLYTLEMYQYVANLSKTYDIIWVKYCCFIGILVG